MSAHDGVQASGAHRSHERERERGKKEERENERERTKKRERECVCVRERTREADLICLCAAVPADPESIVHGSVAIYGATLATAPCSQTDDAAYH